MKSSTMKLFIILFQIIAFSGCFEAKYSYQLRESGDDDSTKPQGKNVVSCNVCRATFEMALGWVEAGDSRDEIVDKMTAVCVDLGVSTERVCHGIVDANTDIVLWIIEVRNSTSSPLTPAQFCGFWLYPDCPLDEQLYTWTLDLDFVGPKPPPQTPLPPADDSPVMKVLQFTDVHVDPNYVPGYNAVCDEPMCCRLDQGRPVNPEDGAGYWGDYRDCDEPYHAFEDQLQEAANRHQDIAYVIFTGDIVDHGWWATNTPYNIEIITYVRDQFALYFPDAPLIPIVGNHEAHPTNVFSDPLKTEIPANISTVWLYELWADLWTSFPPDAKPDILGGGMFSMEIRPGLVVIGVNTMFCYSYNMWLLYDSVDPANELMWLANRLLEVETTGKKAHILAHHPSGRPDCMHFWSSQYRRIIDRFENVIVAQFHGHTHNDQFNLYYDAMDPSRPTGVAFTAGCGTPASNRNPNYRSYKIDGDYPQSSFRVLDHETWYYNLTEANLAGPSVSPNWQLLYSFNAVYNVSTQLPDELDALVHRMANDTALQEQYWRYYVKEGDTSLAKGCDTKCLEDLVCEIVVTVHGDNSKCLELFP
ncbi:hypothetical protein B566_EDAN009863 [Ephemera danica]|nr:hypothetical protein B566_EDAN009863 [Ephemera danica]